MYYYTSSILYKFENLVCISLRILFAAESGYSISAIITAAIPYSLIYANKLAFSISDNSTLTSSFLCILLTQVTAAKFKGPFAIYLVKIDINPSSWTLFNKIGF